MKWIGIGVIGLLVLGLLWWAFGGERGPQARTVELTVIAQSLYGAGSGVVKVKQGDQVTIQITVDEPMELFLHGYDLEVEARPGIPGTVRFTANAPGFYPLMIHALGEEEGSHNGEQRVEILLGYVEVSPRK